MTRLDHHPWLYRWCCSTCNTLCCHRNQTQVRLICQRNEQHIWVDLLKAQNFNYCFLCCRWNGPNQANLTVASNNLSNQKREREMETFLPNEKPKENGHSGEYTVIPLEDVPENGPSYWDPETNPLKNRTVRLCFKHNNLKEEQNCPNCGAKGDLWTLTPLIPVWMTTICLFFFPPLTLKNFDDTFIAAVNFD